MNTVQSPRSPSVSGNRWLWANVLSGAAILAASALWSANALAHGGASAASRSAAGDRHIQFPDVPGYQTLVVDLHSHSVFSDGHVWPKIRIEEALRDGLDGFAVTEHLEWQPHRADIPHPDRNRAYVEAAAAAEGTDLIVIAGSEITRDLPAGHINAVFISDANALLQVGEPPAEGDDVGGYYAAASEWPPEEAVAAANAQNAFVFMNHPDWPRQRADGIARLSKLQRTLIRNKLIHGIEIANGRHYSEEAFAIALKHNLAVIGVSDVHDLIDWDYPPAQGAHRPVTLVFAVERTADGIAQALRERRNVVWFKNRLMGRADALQPLLEASLQVVEAAVRPETQLVTVTLRNTSDARFELKHLGRMPIAESDARFSVAPHSEQTITLKPGKLTARLKLAFEVENALLAPGKPARLDYAMDIDLPDVARAP